MSANETKWAKIGDLIEIFDLKIQKVNLILFMESTRIRALCLRSLIQMN